MTGLWLPDKKRATHTTQHTTQHTTKNQRDSDTVPGRGTSTHPHGQRRRAQRRAKPKRASLLPYFPLCSSSRLLLVFFFIVSSLASFLLPASSALCFSSLILFLPKVSPRDQRVCLKEIWLQDDVYPPHGSLAREDDGPSSCSGSLHFSGHSPTECQEALRGKEDHLLHYCEWFVFVFVFLFCFGDYSFFFQ